MCEQTTSFFRYCNLVGTVVASWAMFSGFAGAQNGNPLLNANGNKPSASANYSSRALMAIPKSETPSPFMSSSQPALKRPVSLGGYCIVSLREQQTWQLGLESHQLLFDGQLYWFANARQEAMFAAAPLRYVPALGGHCIVTFAESGERVQGEAQYGILHDQRLFFFRGPKELKAFQAQPTRYAPADLANNGRCLVSQVEARQQLPGLPETTVIIDGQRYQFSGVHQQKKFLLDPERYGITPLSSDAEVPAAQDVKKNQVNSDKVAGTKLPKDPPLSSVPNKVMGGYCPVSIREKQDWVEGKPRYRVEFDGKNYLMAGRAEQKLFAENPNAYVPAFGGYCVVTEFDEKRHVQGNIYHTALHVEQDRFFLFAGVEQKQAFDAHPERYVNVDLAARGICMVSKLDDGKTIAGLPELIEWYQGKRYFFATPEYRSKFLENKSKYAEKNIIPVKSREEG